MTVSARAKGVAGLMTNVFWSSESTAVYARCPLDVPLTCMEELERGAVHKSLGPFRIAIVVSRRFILDPGRGEIN